MKCPGCEERVYEEELVNGSCPLCGQDIDLDSGGYGDTINEIVDLFEEDPETMAVNIEKATSLGRRLVLEREPGLLDRVKPKKCSTCGRWHVKFGVKQLDISIKGDHGDIAVNYYCVLCKPRNN